MASMKKRKVNYDGYYKESGHNEGLEPVPSDDIWFKKNKVKLIKKIIKIQELITPKTIETSKITTTCGICGLPNGNEKFSCSEIDDVKNIWTWPSGFIHYIEEHNIPPRPQFIEKVLGIKIPKDSSLASPIIPVPDVESILKQVEKLSIEEKKELMKKIYSSLVDEANKSME